MTGWTISFARRLESEKQYKLWYLRLLAVVDNRCNVLELLEQPANRPCIINRELL